MAVEQLVSPEQIEVWRQKVRTGSMPIEELRQAIIVLRQGRITAASQTPRAKSKASAAEAQLEAEALLKEFESL